MDSASIKNFSSIVLYSDNHLLALNKEAGLLTQTAEDGRQSLEDMAKAWIKETCKKPGNVFLHSVHRLDRIVSGVVLFARTGKALSRLNSEMRERKIKKTYLAIVSPPPEIQSGELRHFLSHGSHTAKITAKGAPGAKEAVLHYKTLSRSGNFSMIEVILETGRYHQIRAQLAAIGSPIAGDTRYGSRVTTPGDNILLHHSRMELTHPVTGQELSIEAPLPLNWKDYAVK